MALQHFFFLLAAVHTIFFFQQALAGFFFNHSHPSQDLNGRPLTNKVFPKPLLFLKIIFFYY